MSASAEFLASNQAAAGAPATPPAQGVYVPLDALHFSGAVPAPFPQCPEPTPDEQVRRALDESKKIAEAKDEEAQKRAAEDEKKTSGATTAAVQGGNMKDTVTASATEVLTSMKSVANAVLASIQHGASDMTAATEMQVRQLDHQRNYDRFKQNFPELAKQGEVLIVDYGCSAMHVGQSVAGHLQLTRNHLCFTAQLTSPISSATENIMAQVDPARRQSTKGVGIKQVIALKDIVSVQPSVTLPVVDGGAPYFMVVPDAKVIPTALQIYSKEGNTLFQFLSFDSFMAKAGGALSKTVKGTVVDRAYNYIDHSWREAVTVPVDGVEYA